MTQKHCATCGTAAKTDKRLPAGWKRSGEDVYCRACWQKLYVLRTVAMPVVSPLDSSWDELRPAVRKMWQLTTQASNWIMTDLFSHDVRRTDQVKIPPMPPTEHDGRSLYLRARDQFPELPSGSMASITQSVTKRYKAARYEVNWTCASSLPTFRYPVPFPVRAQDWTCCIYENAPVVNVRIGDEGGRYRLRLKSGPQFRRQYRQFRQLATGNAVPGELAIYERRETLMVKMVAWLPREQQQAGERDGVLCVRSAADNLLVALNTKDETLWRYNGDQLRRWSEEHARHLKRWSEDGKYENRPVPSFADRREAAGRKYRDRMNSACHEIAAQLAGYAVRRRFAAVRYDDSERGFCQQLPWFRLRSLIHEKLDERGIALEIVSRVAQEKTQDSLAEE